MSDLGAYRNKEVLLKAAGELGVQEWSEGSNPQIEKYLDHGSSKSNKDSGLTDDVPWCSTFVSYCLEMVGMTSTDNLSARSYLGWGKSSLDDPLPGDIVIFWRGKRDGWQGHVAFFVKDTKNHVYCLGGNQADECNVTLYSKARILDIRRSSKSIVLGRLHRIELSGIADLILSGSQVQKPGKVV